MARFDTVDLRLSCTQLIILLTAYLLSRQIDILQPESIRIIHVLQKSSMS